MPSEPCYAFLSAPKAVLRVIGEDAFSFLQGQFSNQLRQQPGEAVYGLWLNQKGRVVADSSVLCISISEFLVVSEESPGDVIRQRLEDYIVADDVALTDETTVTAGVILGGKDARAALDGLFATEAAIGKFVRTAGGALVFGGPGAPMAWWRILGPADQLPGWEHCLRTNECRLIGREDFDRIRISEGIPAVPQDLGPGDLPNEGGLEQTAISYSKGCYLGQEVMARLKNLGQVRRRLHIVRGVGELPRTRDLLYQGAKKVGELRSLARDGKGFVGFAMLSLAQLEPNAALSLAPDGDPLIHLELRHG